MCTSCSNSVVIHAGFHLPPRYHFTQHPPDGIHANVAIREEQCEPSVCSLPSHSQDAGEQTHSHVDPGQDRR